MDTHLQNVLPCIAKYLDKEYVEGECCISTRNEDYLNKRAETSIYFRNYTRQHEIIVQTVKYNSVISAQYKRCLISLLALLNTNNSVFEPDSFDNIYFLFGFYCPLRLTNAGPQGGKNLIVYIIVDPKQSMWNTFCSWSGLNTTYKYLGYNVWLPPDQY